VARAGSRRAHRHPHPSPGTVTAGPAPAGRAKPVAQPAPLIGNRLLNLPGAGKEVRQFTFDISGTGLIYQAGDALAVTPRNCPDLIAEWLTLTGMDGGTEIELAGAPVELATALRDHLDITRLTPDLLRFVAERTGSEDLKTLLRGDNKVELAKWSWGRQAADLLAEHPVRANAQDWADVLKKLQPRLYSISSSPLTNPVQVSLTVSVIRLRQPHPPSTQGRQLGFPGRCPHRLAGARPGPALTTLPATR
jgi:sulfite reductase alpha subunit-like flavoprotein